MNEIQKVNKQIDILQQQLLQQLQSGSIEYIDLLTYYNRLESLKAKKTALYLQTF